MGRADPDSGPNQVICARFLHKQGMPELLSLHELPCGSSGLRMDTGAIELIVILHRKTLEKA